VSGDSVFQATFVDSFVNDVCDWPFVDDVSEDDLSLDFFLSYNANKTDSY